MTRLIFEVNLDKHIEDNFPAQRFENAFQRDLSQSKRCSSSGEAAFFAVNMQTLVNTTQHFRN